MKIEVREIPHKTVFFWLSRAEAADSRIMNSLTPQFKIFKNQGYTPVVFESGIGNLENSIYMLLKHNYEILAKKELTAETAVRS